LRWSLGLAFLSLAGCGSASLPRGDGGAGGRAGSGGWCATQPAPAAGADASCVDFDEGAVPSSWTLKTAGSTTQSLTSAHASSLPQSWQATVPAGSAAAQATLTWHDTGAKPVATVTAAVDLSPVAAQGVAAWTGSVQILCVKFGLGRACLEYTMDADTGFASGYTGFYVSLEYDGGGAMYSEKPLSASVPTGIWTRAQLQVTASSHAVVVTLGGSASPALTGYFDPDTAVDVVVGPNASGSTSGWSGYFDNVTAVVTRSQ
jgi:hypothetical protein